MKQLADVTRDEVTGYFLHLAGRVERSVRSLPGSLEVWGHPLIGQWLDVD